MEGWSYDVFLSFHGKDTRKNFTDHLYYALRNSGIYTFRDDVELPTGGVFGSKLQEAIESSKILVVVFSKNYASSSWCLDELLHIMKCSNSNSQQLVFPIFHDIDPSDIRRLKGTVSEFLAKHESRHPLDKVQSWRVALTAAANLSGWDLTNKHEAEGIKDIVREILKKLDNSYLHVASYPVGITSRIKHIYPLLSVSSDDVRVIGICGMGGSGKTTIAKAAYNEFSHLFQGKSFLADVREYSKKPEGKIHLQQQLFSDILKRRDVEFNSIDNAIKERFRRKRVLVIIDDVEDLNQLNSVAIDISWFGPGSRLIVTTRNKHLLKQLGVKNVYIPDKLNGGESLDLFSWHAFRTNEPPQEFLGLSKNVVKYCGGLPLAVEVLGAFLSKRSICEWKSALQLLKRTPDDQIQEKLRISFDALSNVQKDIFLDIACFFIGMDKDYVIHVLDGCGFSPDIGLSVLTERCLVVVYDNKLMMHDLIRDMGREIVREKSPKNCGKLSRLWDPDDVIDVLTKNSGTDAVEGLSLKAQGLDLGNLDATSFSTLRELRLLQLSHIQVEGNYAHFPKGLRWLCWHGFPLEFLPANFYLRSLVVMDMQYSSLKRLWNAPEAQSLKRLKFLDLSHSLYLMETPNFSFLPNLEKLLLIGCKSLVMVHKSIGTLCGKLVLVNMNGCAELEDLPADFYKLKSLETLILSGCLKLKNLDDGLGEMESLKTLLADYTAIREVPSSIGQLKKLKNLSLCGGGASLNDYVRSGKCPQSSRLIPVSLQGLSCLSTLRLRYCNLSDELIPKDLGSLSCLEELDLGGNNFHNLQTDFASLLNLRILRLDNCTKLQSILGLPRTLKSLHATNCISLERTSDLSECLSLQALYLTNCLNLVETPGLDKLKTVRLIRMEMCNRITDTFKESILQGWAVNGYGGIFLPGSRLPNWFSFKDEQNSVSFTVPETLDLDLIGFTLCTRYIGSQDDVMSFYSPKITVTNRTKGSVWIRWPATLHILMYLEEHLWQGHLSNEELLVEMGDQVEVDMNFGDQVTILETGVALLYEAKEGYAASLCKAATANSRASIKRATISIQEHSTGISQTRKSIDENEHSSGSKRLRHQKAAGQATGKTTKERRWKNLRKMALVLRILLGAFGFFLYAVAWQIVLTHRSKSEDRKIAKSIYASHENSSKMWLALEILLGVLGFVMFIVVWQPMLTRKGRKKKRKIRSANRHLL